MRPPGIDERRDNNVARHSSRSRWDAIRPGRSVWRFSAIVATGWAIIVAALASAARVLAPDGEEPSWGEVVAATTFNFVLVFVGVAAASLIVRAVSRRRRAATGPDDEATLWSPSWLDRSGEWTVRGHPVVPTTTEGRWALLTALLGLIPFVGGPALFAAPVLLVLAVRKGDRGLLLVLPLLAGLFLVVFVLAEFTIGHD
jgi:hypothetical protein